MASADKLYSGSKGVTFNGVHLFSRGDKPIAPASISSPVRVYLRAEMVRCADGTHAVHRFRQEAVAIARESVSQRDLPSHLGFVANDAGDVTHWFAPNGLLYELVYLGRTGQEAATSPYRMPDLV